MSRCKDTGLMGPRCALDEGHDGPHMAQLPSGLRTWTHEDTLRQMRDWEAKGGGWE